MNEQLEVQSFEELVSSFNSLADSTLRLGAINVTDVGVLSRLAIFFVDFATPPDCEIKTLTSRSFLTIPEIVNEGLDAGWVLTKIYAVGVFAYKYHSCNLSCEIISKPPSYTMVKTLPGVVHPVDITGTISATDVELSIDGVRIEGFPEEPEKVEAEDLAGEYSEFLENDVEPPILSAIDLEYAATIETKKDLAEYASQFEITLKKNRSLKNMLRDLKKISADGEING